MKSQLTLALTILAVSAFTVSCGGGDLDNKQTGISSIAGLYAWNFGDDDEGYHYISESGSLSIYDYAGDSFDNAGNCYWIAENFATFTHVSDYNYLQETNSTGATSEISIRRTSSGISFSGVDEDGPFTANFLNSDLSISDFIPTCPEAMTRPSSKGTLK